MTSTLAPLTDVTDEVWGAPAPGPAPAASGGLSDASDVWGAPPAPIAPTAPETAAAGPSRLAQVGGWLDENVVQPAQRVAGEYTGAFVRGSNAATQGAAVLGAQTGAVSPDTAVRSIVQDEKDAEAYKASPEVQAGLKEIQEADGFLPALAAIARNPYAASVAFMESVPQMGASIGAGIAGTFAGAAAGSAVPVVGTAVGATAGGMAGTFAASGASEYASTLLDTFKEAGVPMEEEALKAAFQNPELMERARQRAVARGMTVGAFDALSFGIAGKLLKPVTHTLGGGAVARGAGAATEGLTQAALGGGGEAAGQIAADGRVTSWGDVALESALELPGSAIEVPAAMWSREAAAGQGTPPAPPPAPGAPPPGNPMVGLEGLDAVRRELAPELGAAGGQPPPAGPGAPPAGPAPAPALNTEVNTPAPAPVPQFTPEYEMQAAYLLALGETPESIAAMNEAERKAGMEDAREFGAQPLPPDQVARILTGAPPAPKAAPAPAAPQPENDQTRQANQQAALKDLLDDPRPLDQIKADIAAQQAQAAWPETVQTVRNAVVAQPLPPTDVAGYEGMSNPAEIRADLARLSTEAKGLVDTGGADPAAGTSLETTLRTIERGINRLKQLEGSKAAPVTLQAPEDVHAGAHQTADPTPGQMEAGNYKKRHVKWQGFNISIETEAGQDRVAKDGSWRVTMPAPYGDLKGTIGADGDPLDIYVGPNPNEGTVYVIDQRDAETGDFDEHKIMMGFPSEEAARETYHQAFSDGRGPDRLGAVKAMSVQQFKQWVKKGKHDKPVAYVKPKAEKPAPKPDLDTMKAEAAALYAESTDLAAGDPDEWKAVHDRFIDKILEIEAAHGTEARDRAHEEAMRAYREPATTGGSEAKTPENPRGLQAQPTPQHNTTVGTQHEDRTDSDLDGTPADWPAPTMEPEDVFPPPPEGKVFAEKQVSETLTPAQAKARLNVWKAIAKRIGEKEDNSNKVVVSLFDRTGVWSQPWRDAGYQVMQYDITQGDDLLKDFPISEFREAIEQGFEFVGVLAAPPCTSFAISGARWWKDEHDAPLPKMVEKKYGTWAAEYFDTPLDYANTLVAATQFVVELVNPNGFHVLENPIGRIASQNGLPDPLLTWDPHHYGDPYTKKTQLWGKFNPNLPQANVEPKLGSLIAKLRGDVKEQKARRSETPEGFAYAFFLANHPGALDMWEAERRQAEPTRETSGSSTEHPGLVIKSLETGKETTIQPAGTTKPTVPVEDARDVERARKASEAGQQAARDGDERKPPAHLRGPYADAWLAGYADVAAKATSESQAVQDFIDGKREDAPTIEEVEAEQAAKAAPAEKSTSDIFDEEFDALFGGKEESAPAPAEKGNLFEGLEDQDRIKVTFREPIEKDGHSYGPEVEGSFIGRLGNIEMYFMAVRRQGGVGETVLDLDPETIVSIERTKSRDQIFEERYERARGPRFDMELERTRDGYEKWLRAIALEIATTSDNFMRRRQLEQQMDDIADEIELSQKKRKWLIAEAGYRHHGGEKQYPARDDFTDSPADAFIYDRPRPKDFDPDPAKRRARGEPDRHPHNPGAKLKELEDAGFKASYSVSHPMGDPDNATLLITMPGGKEKGRFLADGKRGKTRWTWTLQPYEANSTKAARDRIERAQRNPDYERLRTILARKDVEPAPIVEETSTDDKQTSETNKQTNKQTAGEAAKSAAKNTIMGLAEATDAFATLFGAKNKGTLGSGPVFDEETYRQALPIFRSAAYHFREAASDVAAMMRAFLKHLNEVAGIDPAAIRAAKPYIVRFVDEVKAGNIQLEETSDAEQPSSVGQEGEREASGEVAEGRAPGTGPDPVLAGEPSEDVRGTDEGGSGRGDGARAPQSDAGRGTGVSEGRDGADGREGAGGTGLADAGAGDGGRRADRPEPASVRPNFHIADPESLVGGSPKVRFARNKAAIETYRAITEEGRDPTPEELDTIARYIGWGSFGQELFKGTWERREPKKGWEEEDAWLRDHLGQAEWESAQASIINAHYTDPPTVTAMWKMVERMGFKGGRVLEPSMGIGNFFGLMPRDLMAKSDLTGIELDKLTGGMAKLLYPGANIQIKGYQDSKTADGFYDVAIGNWPFAAQSPSDRRYNKLGASLHDYFFVKALDQVRPGGIVIGITSSGTMDKAGKTVRAHLAKNAELVAAYRLPSGAFEKYAGTNVVTDIIILKKREAPLFSAEGSGWLNQVEYGTPAGETIKVNEYFVNNPGNVLGVLNWGHGTTQGRPGMIVDRPADLMERLEALPDRVPEGTFEPVRRGKEPRFVNNTTTARQNSIVEQDGSLYLVQGDRLAALEDMARYKVKSEKETARREDQIRRLVAIGRQYHRLLEAEREGAEDVETIRKELNKLYKAFKKEHGSITESDGLRVFRSVGDPNAPALAALEYKGKPATILTESTTRAKKKLEAPTIRDAFVLARNESTAIDLDRVAEIAKKPRAEVEAELVKSKAVYRTPGGGFEAADVYLSGNVRRKMREAEAAAELGEDMAASIEALKGVMPKDVPYFQIEAKLGATWVGNETYRNFIADLLGVDVAAAEQIEVRFTAGSWKVTFHDPNLNGREEARVQWGMAGYPFSRLVTAALNNQTITLKTKDADGNDIVDVARTNEANEKAARLREEFPEWAWRDPERRVELETAYNEVMNAIAIPKFDGSFLEFPGMALRRGNDPFSLRQHQVNAIWRGVVNGRGLYAHEVGTGKTYTMGGIAVESRRYGVARKPLILAHNANSATVAREINDMYPGARVLYVDNLSPATVKVTLSRIANEDWDAIVLPHSLVDKLALTEATLMEIAREEIDALEQEAIDAAAEDGIELDVSDMDSDEAMKRVRSPTAKDLVKVRNQIIEKIKKWGQRASGEDAISFESLGIDMVIVDEAHEFKKPPIATRMRIKGLNTGTSDASIALMFLTDYVRKTNGGKGVHIFTGTPITNTLTEIFNQMRYVMKDVMALDGVDTWDAWFNTFADSTNDIELTPTGQLEPVKRLAQFVNVAELRRMAGQFMDIVFADDMPEFTPRETPSGKTLADPGLTKEERDFLENGRSENPQGRPYKKVITEAAEMSPQLRVVRELLVQRANTFKNASPRERKEMSRRGDPEAPLRVESDAASSSLDIRLYDMQAEDHPNSKANRAVRNVLEIYNSHDLATQVIFVDQGYEPYGYRSVGEPGEKKKIKVPKFPLVDDIVSKLVAGGIPRDQIAVVKGSVSKEKRKEIADKMNTGEIRVVIGLTKTLGVGVNMQVNLRAMHHLDAPWMPGELEQRNGRGHRQGNKWNTVLEYRYLTEGIDGRRWQVLSVKDRFIKAFMKADENTRIIEGDATGMEESESGDSIAETLSEAAGDPRLMLLNKFKADVERLERRERNHTHAIAQARQTVRRLEQEIPNIEADIKRIGADVEVYAPIKEAGTFTAEVDGTTFDKRAEAQEAIDAKVRNLVPGEGQKILARVQGFTLYAKWDKDDSLYFWIKRTGAETSYYVKASLQSIEGTLRGLANRLADEKKDLADRERTLARMKDAAKQPFAQQQILDTKRKLYEDLETDLQANPVPAPKWLRHGAPVNTEMWLVGKKGLEGPRVVQGHRWTDKDWLIVTEEGEVSYADVRGQDGSITYPVREFKAPPAIEGGPERPAAKAKRETDPEDIEATRFEGEGGTAYSAVPAGWDNAGDLAEEDRPRLTPEVEAEITRIVREVAGLTPDIVEDDETDALTMHPEGAAKWGAEEGDLAAAVYQHQGDPAWDSIIIARSLWDDFGIRTAYHEAFHRLQNWFFTKKELRVLKAARSQLAKIVQADMARGETVKGMAGSEIEAEAFAIYKANPSAPGIPANARTVFARLLRFLRRLQNAIMGRGFQTWQDVFDKAASGEVAKRAPQSDRGRLQSGSYARRPSVANPPFETLDQRSTYALAQMFWPSNWAQLGTLDNWRDVVRASRRFWQDKFVDLKAVQKNIEAATGRAIALGQNAYLMESLYHGRTGEKLETFYKGDVKAIMETMRAHDLTPAEVDDYLIALHVAERNNRIAELYEVEDPTHDFVKARTNPNIKGGSGFSLAWARGIRAQAQQSGKLAALNQIARRVRAITAADLNEREAAGLISSDIADAIRAAYKNYVPLRGFETDDEAGSPGTGRGLDTRGKETHRALGRRSRADSPLAYVFTQRAQGIVRAEKNRVGKTFLRLVAANPHPGLWEINRVEQKPRLVVRTDPVTGDVYEAVDTRATPPSRIADNVFIVKEGGQEVYVTIHDVHLAAAMKNLGAENLNLFLRAMAKVTRLLAALSTSWNPEWFVTNLTRDLQTAAIQISDENRAGLLKAMGKNWAPAIKGAFEYERGKVTSRWGAIAKEFADQGGKVNVVDMRGVEYFKHAIAKEATRGELSRWLKNGTEKLGDGIDSVTSAIENAIRIAAYKALVDQGVPKAKAASVARELTVNFNRKGNAGPFLNSLYMFYNAAIQGNVRMVQSIYRSKFTRAAVFGVLPMIGLLEALLAAAGDDDDEDEYKRIDQWVSERNIIIMLRPLGLGAKGQYVKIPMPYGFNVFKVFGTEAGRVMIHGTKPVESMGRIMSAVAAAANPLGGQDFIAAVTPTVLDPILEIARNKNFFGSTIKPDYPNDKRPESEQKFPNVNPMADALTRWLNNTTGGNTFKEGAISISPEHVEHLITAYTGGAGRLVVNVQKFVTDMVTGRPIDTERMPFLRQVYGNTTGEMPTYRAWRTIREEADDMWNEFQGQSKAGNKTGAEAAKDRDPVLWSLMGPIKATEKRLDGLRKRERQITASAIPENQKETQLAKLREEQHDAMRDMLEKWDAAHKKAKN